MESTVSPIQLSNCRILVIDDSQVAQYSANKILRDFGYGDIKSVEDPRDALRLVEVFRPRLILLDLVMPFVDGITILQAIKPEMDQGKLAVIIASAINDERKLAEARSLGATLFLNKPFSDEQLTQTVARALGLLRV